MNIPEPLKKAGNTFLCFLVLLLFIVGFSSYVYMGCRIVSR